MAPRNLHDMTWEEVRDLDLGRAVAILPVGAVEAHGPHLPLGTDLVIAEAMARAGAQRIEAQGRPSFLLPSLAYTPAPFAARFPGTLSIGQETAASVLLDLARELTRHRVSSLAIANAHWDPAQLATLAAAAARAREERLLPVIWPDLTRKPWVARLTEEFRSGACHAGRYEGSVVLAARPDLVRDAIRKELPPNPASLSIAIREGKRTFDEAGGSRAYFGWPADATAEEGNATIAALGAILAEAVLEALASGRAA